MKNYDVIIDMDLPLLFKKILVIRYIEMLNLALKPEKIQLSFEILLSHYWPLPRPSNIIQMV